MVIGGGKLKKFHTLSDQQIQHSRPLSQNVFGERMSQWLYCKFVERTKQKDAQKHTVSSEILLFYHSNDVENRKEF